eukprot:461801_1
MTVKQSSYTFPICITCAMVMSLTLFIYWITANPILTYLNNSISENLDDLNILTDNERIKYYLAKWYKHSTINLHTDWNTFNITSNMYHLCIFNEIQNHKQLQLNKNIHKTDRGFKGRYINYIQPVLQMLHYSTSSNNFKCINKQNEILVVTGDIWKHNKYENYPVFGKARPIFKNNSNNSLILIQTMKYSRHWQTACNNLHKLDIPWNKKQKKVIFRGASTDGFVRRSFVRQYINYSNINASIDVGFTKLSVLKDETMDDLLPLRKSVMSIRDLLKYKYLVSIEGNDVASNLNWILMSNSVPFMRKPVRESWLMEGLL